MSRGGWEYATRALAVYDSPAAAVVVSLGAGGPGIGRRVARPPRTKNRGIRRTRDDARRGIPPRAARPRWRGEDKGGVPRRTRRQLDSGFRSGFALWSAHGAQESWFRANRRPHARLRHRCEYRRL